MGGKFHPKLNLHSRLIENKYREGKVKRTLKRELKVPEISGSEADGTGFLRLDCCAQGTPYLHFARVVGLLSCNVSRCGYQRTVAVRAGVRLLDRCLRVARGAFCLLSWCERCVSNWLCLRSADTLVGADLCACTCYASDCKTWLRRRWGQGCIRPVLKHGPRSLTCVRVCTMQSCTRSEGTCCDIGDSGRPRSSGRGLSRSTFVRTRKMVNYACVG